jgi:hypothetical protein
LRPRRETTRSRKPECKRLVQSHAGIGVRLRDGAQVEVIGVEALGRLRASTSHLRPAERRLDGAGHSFRDPVLEGEDLGAPALEAVRPYVAARLGFDEPTGEPHAPFFGLHRSAEDGERTPSSRPTVRTSTLLLP